jgi:probable F420-dependent oxidoreductase
VTSGLVREHGEIPSFILRLEQAGAAQVSITDRILMTDDIGHPGGSSYPDPVDTPYPEPLVMLAAIAAGTSTIRLSTGILIAPIRHPIVLAKAAATVDVVSAGRLDLGLGAGWFEPEFAAVGATVAERFMRLEEAIQVCRALWSETRVSFEGRWTTLQDATARPGPYGESIPIWIGTQARPTARTARRIAEWADGWSFSSASELDDIKFGLGLLEQACQKVDRDPASIPIRAQLRLRPGDSRWPQFRTLDDEVAWLAEMLTAYGEAGIGYVSIGYGSVQRADEAVQYVADLARLIGLAVANSDASAGIPLA